MTELDHAEVVAAVEALRAGRVVVLEDDLSQPSRGCLLVSAASISPAAVLALVHNARAATSAVVSHARALDLGLMPMTAGQTSDRERALVSVEAREGVTTGISAEDRARTLHVLATASDPRRDLVTPGHIFPYRASNGGVLVRPGIPEGCVDLLVKAELPPVGAFAWCLTEDGSYREGGFQELAQTVAGSHIRLSAVVRMRLSSETIVERIATAVLPTAGGSDFRAVCFRSKLDGAEHVALVKGNIEDDQPPVLVRVQSEHGLGDLLGLQQQPTRHSLQQAISCVEQERRGIVVYIRRARKGVLLNQVMRLNSPEAAPPNALELREFGIGAQILQSLGVRRLRLLTNSQRTPDGLHAFGLEVVERVPFP